MFEVGEEGMLDNSRICQLTDWQLVDWTTHGLDISQTDQLVDWTSHGLDKSWTGQLVDATGDFACLVFIFFWSLVDVFLCVYLNIYYAGNSDSFIICPHSLIMQLKQQLLLPAASLSCPVHDLSSP